MQLKMAPLSQAEPFLMMCLDPHVSNWYINEHLSILQSHNHSINHNLSNEIKRSGNISQIFLEIYYDL